MKQSLERDSLLDQLELTLQEVTAGQGHVVLVSGEAGIGNTSLVDHFTGTHRDSIRILWGACDSLFTPRPLGPLYDIASRAHDINMAREQKRTRCFNGFSFHCSP